MLIPLGFARLADNDNLRGLSSLWASPHVVVEASYEPPEVWGDVTVGRRWKDTRPEEQPYWSKVHLAEILLLRNAGAMPPRPPGRERIFATPEHVARWAAEAAKRLATQTDLLRGEGLEIIDRIIAETPKLGVPGLDYPE